MLVAIRFSVSTTPLSWSVPRMRRASRAMPGLSIGSDVSNDRSAVQTDALRFSVEPGSGSGVTRRTRTSYCPLATAHARLRRTGSVRSSAATRLPEAGDVSYATSGSRPDSGGGGSPGRKTT